MYLPRIVSIVSLFWIGPPADDLELLQKLMQLRHKIFRLDILLYVFGNRLQQKADQCQPLIKFRVGGSVADFLRIRAVQDARI